MSLHASIPTSAFCKRIRTRKKQSRFYRLCLTGKTGIAWMTARLKKKRLLQISETDFRERQERSPASSTRDGSSIGKRCPECRNWCGIFMPPGESFTFVPTSVSDLHRNTTKMNGSVLCFPFLTVWFFRGLLV